MTFWRGWLVLHAPTYGLP